MLGFVLQLSGTLGVGMGDNQDKKRTDTDNVSGSNASGLTIIPVTIIVYRTQLGAVNPADIFIPIMIATFAATMAGLISVSVVQKINLLTGNTWLYRSLNANWG